MLSIILCEIYVCVCVVQGLEKYVMTKLFSRTFASTSEDVKIDQEISEKICLLQTFLRPKHLDIPTFLQNEASWLVWLLNFLHGRGLFIQVSGAISLSVLLPMCFIIYLD